MSLPPPGEIAARRVPVELSDLFGGMDLHYTPQDYKSHLENIVRLLKSCASSSEVARYKMAKLLAKASPYLLLLTATPHCGKTEPFLRLVRLLDEQAFPDSRAIVKEQVAPYVIRTEKREAVDHEGKRLFKERITRVIEVKWNKRHSMQKELYELVTRYVVQGYNQAVKEKKYYIGFLMVLMQRLVSSSTAAIRDSIARRMDILKNQQAQISQLSLEDWAEVDAETALEDLLAAAAFDIKAELGELEHILAVARQAEHQFWTPRRNTCWTCWTGSALLDIFNAYLMGRLQS